MNDTPPRLERAAGVRRGDVILLEPGWRPVLDVWTDDGFVHVVAADATGLFLPDETVALGAP